MRSRVIALLAGGILLVGSAQAGAANAPGVTDTEITIGQSLPYSGPASAYGQLGRAEGSYFKWLNEQGGINGRKIKFISLDDGYSPPKAVEMARQLVEQDHVALIMGTLGTPLNMAIRKYLNHAKVPQLFVAAGSTNFADPQHYPWTMGWQPTLSLESHFYAKHILATNPHAKVAALYQNDDFGKDLMAGLESGLGDKADKMIVATASYEATDPTVDSQIVTLKASGADTLLLFAYPKQAAQAIRKAYDLGWKPDRYLHLGSASVKATFQPAGLEKSAGVMTAGFIKDPSDQRWANDPDVKAFRVWEHDNMPNAGDDEFLNAFGYSVGQTMAQVLRQCGDDLSRENIMRQAANLHDLKLPLLLPGSVINTSPTDYLVVEHVRLQTFNGTAWDFVN